MRLMSRGIVLGVAALLSACSRAEPSVEANVAPVASAQPAAPVEAPPIIIAGVAAGPLAASLTQKDREAAAKAQIEALTSGQRQSWRGAGGAFGFVEPKPAADGGCRNYTHTIFISGRSKSGQGSACPGAGGTWTFAG
jgi:surface antigen